MVRKTANQDVYPQMLRGFVLQSAANTFTESSFPTPNMTEAGFVMELLRVYWEMENVVDIDADAEMSWALYEASRTVLPHLNDAGTIAYYKQKGSLVTEGGAIMKLSGEIDFTDGGGHGLLVGRKELFLGALGSSQTNAIQINLALLYRLVKVSAAEIVGLISS